MGNPISEALIFLVQVVFGLYITIVVLRFLLQLVRADFYNPVSQFVVLATKWPLGLLRRVIPGYLGVDLSSIVLMLVLQMSELILIFLIAAGALPAMPGLLVLSVAELLKLVVNIFFYAIIIQIILSWVSPGAYNPVTVLLYRLTEPLMRPARNLIPPIGGLDLSPMLPLIGLQLVQILLIKPLAGLGYAWSGFLVG